MIEELKSPLYTDLAGASVEVRWNNKSNCCCRMAQFPEGPFWICGHWRMRLATPIFVILAFLISHGMFVFDTYNLYKNLVWQIVGLTVPSVILFCCAFAYIAALCKGPGYVPYNWHITKKEKYTWKEMMDNMVIYTQQAEYARQAPRPPRSSFSIDARRFVLRADHYCDWIQSWVGVKNHRQFLLMLWYTFMYMLANLGFRYWWYLDVINNFKWWKVFGWLTVVFVLYAGFYSLYHFSIAVHHVIKNVTAVEMYNKRYHSSMNKGCLNNCAEICGTKKCLLCWPIPCFMCFKPQESGYYCHLHQDVEQ